MMTLLEDKYSIAIMPLQNGIEFVAKLKNDLYSEIGWYNSRNSDAHITISEFVTHEDEVNRIINHLKEVVSYENPIHLNFDGVNSYANGAVFLAPDEQTKITLTSLMKRIQKNLDIKNSYNSKDPHMSIGRKLSEQNVKIALQMFADVKLDFDCANLVLRKFNPNKRQYEIFSEDFKFLGVEPKPNPQQSLF
ncbi:2'-5' RNA ligase family protein [Pedobacter polaris]|uniref:2'-5' RNA ligase family protein n=1 Tax=Pedobacter polaris TaxID=2571273 RepID=A0A4U1CTA0_9SPHI|nr:2'-5' RNA ligase family protein [Pedobacter polaris]TKC10295.1 2'-5' RNA ligase family protein [Pedobacter polaris]